MNPFNGPDDAEIDRLWHSLRSHVRSRVQDEDQVDDVVQESWLRTIEKPPRRTDRLPAWLRVVARHLIFESLRSRRSRLRREQAAAQSETVPPADEEAVRRDSRVLRMVAELPDPYREVVRLRYIEDMEIAEIAQHLQRSEGTVRSQLKRGLDRLRIRLRAPVEAKRRHRRANGLWLAWRDRARAPELGAISELAGGALLLVVVGTVTWIAIRDSGARDAHAPIAVLAREQSPEGPEPAATLHDDSASGNRALALESADVAAASDTAASAQRATRALLGRVLHRPDGSSIAGARLRAATSIEDAHGFELGSSDDEGRFAVAIPTLPIWVWAAHGAHSPTSRFEIDESFVASGRELVLASVHRGVVDGSVVDANGIAIADAEVIVGAAMHARSERGAQLLRECPAPPVRVRTDVGGRFTAAMPSNGRFEARAPGLAPRSVRIEPYESSVRIVLTAASAAAAAHETAPVDPARTARWTGSLAASARRRGVDLRLKARDESDWTTIAIGDDGAFTTELLAPAEYELVVSGGDAHGAWLAARARLHDGEHADLGTIEPPAPGGVRVRVELPDARASGPASLILNGVATSTRMHWKSLGSGVRIDRDGNAIEIERVWPGAYEIVLRGAGLCDTTVPCEVRAGATAAIDATMAAGFTVFARVQTERALESGERLDGFIETPRGEVLVQRLNALHPTSLDPVTTFNVGVPADATRLVVRTDRGLFGHFDLTALELAQGKRIQISLAQR